ncbi:helix-turn-helix domain-containing protein [Methylobacterium currus]|nr:helix-turn-helix domain-containing protein [Methylobacterium currus]UHC18626.1 helix-turn-helix domain-containing protein [Methylobacterium currus]
MIGDIMLARATFNAQGFVRDAQRIRATPDHIMFHLYKTGGFNGLITGEQTTIWGGQVAVIDLAVGVDTQAAASDTTALIVPRKLLGQKALDRLKPRLEPPQNRLLAAYIASLRERSMRLSAGEVDATVAEASALLGHILDPNSQARPVEAACARTSLLTLAEEVVRANLASPDLSPDWLACELQISRATLYRMFTPHGGIMRYVQERRLLAVQAALSDPLERRRLARLGADLGFNSEEHFSRSFRSRFGVTASEYRRQQRALAIDEQVASPDTIREWWNAMEE